MALQGTLDTFALADLIRLLATTTKTGELAIDGDRGAGRLWFVDGDLVGGEPAADRSAEDALFELLRFTDGEFHFSADCLVDERHEAVSALDVLESAERRLEEWLPVAALVPSTRVALRLAARLDRDEVTVTPAVWEQLLVVAPGTTSGAFGAALGLGEVAAATQVRDLVEMGLVEVGEEVVDDLQAPAEAEAEADLELGTDLEVDEANVETDETDIEAEAGIEAEPEPAWLEQPMVESLGDLGWDEPVDDDPAPLEEISSSLSLAALAAIDEVLPPEPMAPAEERAEEAEDVTFSEASALDELEVDDEELPAIDGLPAIEDFEPKVPESIEAGGDLAVDLDAHLGGAVSDHRYLGGDPQEAVLPEPLPLSEPSPMPSAGQDVMAEDSSPVPGPDTSLDVEPEIEPMEARADAWPTSDQREQELVMQLDALSPAAARAVAAAASSGTSVGDSDAGRRVLRRIISSGRG